MSTFHTTIETLSGDEILDMAYDKKVSEVDLVSFISHFHFFELSVTKSTLEQAIETHSKLVSFIINLILVIHL